MKLLSYLWTDILALFHKGGTVSKIVSSLEAHIVALEHAAEAEWDKVTHHNAKAEAHDVKAANANIEAERATRVAANLKALVA